MHDLANFGGQHQRGGACSISHVGVGAGLRKEGRERHSVSRSGKVRDACVGHAAVPILQRHERVCEGLPAQC